MIRALLTTAFALAIVSVAGPLGADAQEQSPAQEQPQEQAQEQAQQLLGVVLTAGSGEAVSGADVLLRGPVQRRTVTDDEGRWLLEGLSEGRYEVTVRHLAHADEVAVVTIPVAPDSAPVRFELERRAIPLDALVVTASRRPQRLADAVVATELISRERIERSGASDVASVLGRETGIQLGAGHPTGVGVMLQGLDAERVLVLLDGQPLGGRLSGNLDLSRVPTAILERIEVVKGPQATLYGSEAMGGVVNLITRSPDSTGWNGSATVTAGSHGRREVDASLGVGVGEISVGANAGMRELRLAPGIATTAGTGAERRDGHLRARWAGRRDVAVDASVLVVDESQRWRSGQLRYFADNLQWTGRVGAGWSSASGRHRIEPTVYASSFDHLSRRGTSDVPPARSSGERQVQRLWRAELLYALQGDRVRIEAGGEAERESIRSGSIRGNEQERTGLEGFVQVPLTWKGLRIVPGVRGSWSSAWGMHWTPRLAALVRPAGGWALRGSVARGYRAPGFKELHMEFLNIGPGYGYAVKGNPELGPETSTSVNGSAEWAGTSASVQVEIFHNRFHDFIETRLVGDSSGVELYGYSNVDRGRTAGLELDVGYRVGGARVELGYALLETRNDATGEPLLGRARQSGRLTLGHTGRWGLQSSATGTWTGEAAISRDDEGERIRPGFLRIDLRAVQALGEGASLGLGVDNLLDTTIEGWPGFTGRTVHLTLSTELPF